MEETKLVAGPQLKRMKGTTIDYLQEDIMVDIFSRLPVESILECQQVCKAWMSFLSHVIDHRNNDFAKMQLHRHHHRSLEYGSDYKDEHEHDQYHVVSNSKLSFIFMNNSGGYSSSLCYVEFDGNDEQSYKKLRGRFNFCPSSPLAFTTVVGSCNGLVCSTLKISKKICGPVYIHNPITQEYVELPRLVESNDEYKDAGYRIVVYGFGYHYFSDEYKVVRISYKLKPNGRVHSAQIQVYTLGDGKGWRVRGETILRINNFYSHQSVLVNGALHWKLDDERSIAVFDVLKEEFHLLPLPPRCYQHSTLGVMEGWLYVFRGTTLGENNEDIKKMDTSADIWLLKKTNKMESTGEMKEMPEFYKSWNWSREFTVNLECISEYQPFSITKSRQILLWYKEQTIVCYDPETSTSEHLGDLGLSLTDYDKATPHFHSFVSLKVLKEKVEKMKPN